MTDNEIIKALELCSVVPQQCSQCPYYGRKDCVADSAKDAIDFMKRQQERFDRIVEQLEEEKTKFSFPKHCKSIGVCPPDKTCSECIVDKFVEDIIAIVKGVQNEQA